MLALLIETYLAALYEWSSLLYLSWRAWRFPNFLDDFTGLAFLGSGLVTRPCLALDVKALDFRDFFLAGASYSESASEDFPSP